MGLVMETRGKTGPLGGWAVPSETIARTLIKAGIQAGPIITTRRWNEALEEHEEILGATAPFRQPELIRQDSDSTNLFYYGSRKTEFRGRQPGNGIPGRVSYLSRLFCLVLGHWLRGSAKVAWRWNCA